MSMCVLKRNCSTNAVDPLICTSAPIKTRWELLDFIGFDNSYVLRVRYKDCTNYEGIKIMVYSGKFDPPDSDLDPHFCEEDESLIARFRPNTTGWELAKEFAYKISNMHVGE